MFEERAADESGDGSPDSGTPDAERPPAELQRSFWVLVAVTNAAMLAAALGVLFAAFRGESVLGASLLVAGAGLGFYARERYRTVQTERLGRDETKDA